MSLKHTQGDHAGGVPNRQAHGVTFRIKIQYQAGPLTLRQIATFLKDRIIGAFKKSLIPLVFPPLLCDIFSQIISIVYYCPKSKKASISFH